MPLVASVNVLVRVRRTKINRCRALIIKYNYKCLILIPSNNKFEGHFISNYADVSTIYSLKQKYSKSVNIYTNRIQLSGNYSV